MFDCYCYVSCYKDHLADQDASQGKRTEAAQLDVYKLLKPLFQGINDDMGSCNATVHSKVCLLEPANL